MLDFFIDIPEMSFSLAPLIGAGLLAAGGSIAGTIGSLFSNKSNNKANQELAAQQNEYNLQLQQNEFAQNQAMTEYEYAQNLAQWNRENYYNSPEQQMARYQAAGLNPNLIYGTGTASAGNASSSPQFTAAKYSAPRAERATNQPIFRNDFDPYQAVSISQQLGIQRAQKDQISAQADFTRQQTQNAAIDNLIKTVQRSGLEFDLDFKRDVRDLTKEQLYQTLQKTHAETHNAYLNSDLIRARTELTERQRDLAPAQLQKLKIDIINAQQRKDIDAFKYQLLKLGLSDRDPFWSRVISRLFLNPDQLDQVLNF